MPLVPDGPRVKQRAWCNSQQIHDLSAPLRHIMQPQEEPAHHKAKAFAGRMSITKTLGCTRVHTQPHMVVAKIFLYSLFTNRIIKTKIITDH